MEIDNMNDRNQTSKVEEGKKKTSLNTCKNLIQYLT